MINILFLVWLLFLLVVLAHLIKLRLDYGAYPFQNYGEVDIPYITLDIQGNLFNMIVDTGCGVSIINEPALNGCDELLYKESKKKVSLSAITSDSVESKGITVSFNIGKKTVTEDFFIHNTEDFGNFSKLYGIEIHGLLGSSFFDANNCKIDYKKHCLIIP